LRLGRAGRAAPRSADGRLLRLGLGGQAKDRRQGAEPAGKALWGGLLRFGATAHGTRGGRARLAAARGRDAGAARIIGATGTLGAAERPQSGPEVELGSGRPEFEPGKAAEAHEHGERSGEGGAGAA